MLTAVDVSSCVKWQFVLTCVLSLGRFRSVILLRWLATIAGCWLPSGMSLVCTASLSTPLFFLANKPIVAEGSRSEWASGYAVHRESVAHESQRDTTAGQRLLQSVASRGNMVGRRQSLRVNLTVSDFRQHSVTDAHSETNFTCAVM